MFICITCLKRFVFVILVRISPIRNLDPFLEIILCKFFFFCKKNVFLRFYVMYPFNMMRYRTVLRFALEPIAKPNQTKPSHWQISKALVNLRTTVTKLVRVFLPWWMSFCHSHVNPLNAELNPICHMLALLGAPYIYDVSGLRFNTMFSTGVKITDTANPFSF